MRKLYVTTLLTALSLIVLAGPASAQVDGKFSNANAYNYGSGPVSSSSQYLSSGLAPDGSVGLVSHCSDASQCVAPNFTFTPQNWTWSGIAFIEATNKPATLSQITKLSTDFNTAAADCSNGSPRIVISTAANNFTVNLGQAPYGGTCFYGWQNTGNLANSADSTLRWQVNLANTFLTWAAVVAAHGTELVKEIDIIVDSGWGAPRGQAFDVDNFTINTKVMNAADIQHAYGH